MKKEVRGAVLRKYNKHCSYCGRIIKYSDMQIDHMFPKMLQDTLINKEFALSQGITNIDDFNNLMPSCRRCNHYKRELDLEGFREYMKTLHERISKDYINKVAIDYGIITLKPFDGVFYFEKHDERLKND